MQKSMFVSRNSVGATDILPEWDRDHTETAAWSYDIEGNAEKWVERFFDLANKKTEQLHKVACLCFDDHHIKKEELDSVREFSEVC